MVQKNVSVRVGSTFHNRSGQIVGAQKVIAHENFTIFRIFDNDIGLIQLQSPVRGENIKPIPLPPPNLHIPNWTPLTVAGWGWETKTGNKSDILQELDIPYIFTDECRTENRINNITPENLCVGFDNGKKGTCYGDDGDPAIYQGQVVGILSYINDCAQSYNPTVFARVSSFLSWIKKNTA